MSDDTLTFAMGVVVGVVAALLMDVLDGSRLLRVARNDAIAMCEHSLPRDQKCEWVVTARVKGRNK